MARIAYLSSDVIVSVQPAHSIESEFSSHLQRYAGRKDRSLVAANESGVPEVSIQKSYLVNIRLKVLTYISLVTNHPT